MTKTKRATKPEVTKLPVGIPGLGRAGTRVIHDRGHPDTAYELCTMTPLDFDLLPLLRDLPKEAESGSAWTVRLPEGISGVARGGDVVVYCPDAQNSRARLSIVTPLEVEYLPLIKERVAQASGVEAEAAS